MSDTGLDFILKNSFGDYSIESLGWSTDGNDFLMTLVAPKAEGGRMSLRFVWATGVRIEMDFGEYSGRPLVFGSDVSCDEKNNLYHVRLDLGVAPEGVVELCCSDIQVV